MSIQIETTISTPPLMSSPSRSSEVTTSSPSTSPIPTPTACAVDGIWPETALSTNASGSCFKGAVKGKTTKTLCDHLHPCHYAYMHMVTATRHCSMDGSWGDPYCESPQSFLDILAEAS